MDSSIYSDSIEDFNSSWWSRRGRGGPNFCLCKTSIKKQTRNSAHIELKCDQIFIDILFDWFGKKNRMWFGGSVDEGGGGVDWIEIENPFE